MKKQTILDRFPLQMSRADIYETAQQSYLIVEDTRIADDCYILEVKEYFGHRREDGEPCEAASDEDFHTAFEYRSADDETYIREYEDVSIFQD